LLINEMWLGVLCLQQVEISGIMYITFANSTELLLF